MFIRKKKNTSGSVSVQIISKTNGYKVIKTVGCSINKDKIRDIEEEAQGLIDTKFGTQQSMDFGHTETDRKILKCIKNEATKISAVGLSLVLGNIFPDFRNAAPTIFTRG